MVKRELAHLVPLISQSAPPPLDKAALEKAVGAAVTNAAGNTMRKQVTTKGSARPLSPYTRTRMLSSPCDWLPHQEYALFSPLIGSHGIWGVECTLAVIGTGGPVAESFASAFQSVLLPGVDASLREQFAQMHAAVQVYSYRRAATGPSTGPIPIEGLRLVCRRGLLILKGCDWSVNGVYSY
eukprot:1082944-Prorocentrum_minimum.AAC.1